MAHEDVSSIVIEPGSGNMRLGISGDISPTCVVPSAVLRTGDITQYEIPLVGPVSEQAEVITPVIDGVIQDFDAAAGLWTHWTEKLLGMRFDEQPLSITEEIWTPSHSRKQLLETAFESLSVPLFQLVKAPLAATFESSRSTALVVSVGSAMVSAVPVVDGIIRSKATTYTRFAGDFVDAHVLMQLDHAQDKIAPQYQVIFKDHNLKEGEASKENRLGPRGPPSYHAFQLSRLLHTFKSVSCVVNPTPLRGPEMVGSRLFEFPSGYNLMLDHERTVAVEPLFQPTLSSLPDGSTPGINSLGLSEVVYQTLQKVDAPTEVVMSLLSNIILHGGTSKTNGLVERLTNDLIEMMPNYRPRLLHSQAHPVWTGASVLASLNEFDESSWITKQQYEELGAPHLLEKME